MKFQNEPSQDFSETPAFRVKSSWKPAKDHPNLEVFLSKIEENFPRLLKIFWIILILLKLVSPIFYQFFFFFHQMIALQKLWKVILFLLKSFFHSQDIQTFVFFPFLSPLCKHKTTMEVEWFMMSWIGLHKFPDVIFRITQKSLYIIS